MDQTATFTSDKLACCTATSFETKTTGSPIVEEAVKGLCTFHPFVHDENQRRRFMRNPISNTAIEVVAVHQGIIKKTKVS